MQFRHSRSIIISGFAFLLVTLLIAGVSGLAQLNDLNHKQNALDEQLSLKRDLLTTMLSASRERAIALTMIANLEDPFKRDEQMLHYNAMGSRFADAREMLVQMDLTPLERELLVRQGHTVASGVESQHHVIELANDDRLDEARVLLTTSAIPTQQQVFALLQQLYDIELEIHRSMVDQVTEENRSSFIKTLILLAIFSLLTGAITALVVIRQISQGETELLRANERFDLAMRGANDGLWDWDLATDRVYYSPRWKQMLGYDVAGLDDSLDVWESRIHPDDRDLAEHDIAAHLRDETPHYENIQRMRHRDGSYRWHLERGIAVRDKDGKAVRLTGTNTDITQLKLTEEALFEEKERALVTLHSIGDAVVTTDQHGNISYLNPIAEKLTGWSNEHARGQNLEKVCPMIDDDHKVPLPNPVTAALQKKSVHALRCSTVLLDKSNQRHAITASAAPITDSNGNAIGAIMVLRDVSESREMARRLSWQASHDALTGLFNRQEFEQRLAQMLQEAQRDNVHHALLYVDLDQFKLVNDTCGHLAGDELLRQLGYMLKLSLRDTDTLARLGGDEFGVLLSHCQMQKANEIAESLRKVVHEFRFVWQEKHFEIGASIGIVPIDQRSESSTALMSAADLACYAAKDRGRNRIHLYVPDDAELSRRHGEMEWVSRIRSALIQNRFLLYRQAIYSIQAGIPVEAHTEILVRMMAEDGCIIDPGQFIPAAERYDLMPQIDRKVVELTLAHLAHDHTAPHSVAINLSGASIGNEEFLEFVRAQINASGINPGRLCFEITETAAIANLASAMHFMGELKKMGCYFALDDFGSGLSSFSYLKNLPVDYLKIDGSFIRDVVDDPHDRAMVEAISRVGHAMGLKTVAEYVENDAILQLLRYIGIDYAQGHAIEVARPLIENPDKITVEQTPEVKSSFRH
jgi:diguanylate cyclase (GGDEF)-like protein/PAS domain S-box-containing protein